MEIMTPGDGPPLLNLPFDQYERYTITQVIAAIVRSSLKRQRLTVLDVGGAPGYTRGLTVNEDCVVVEQPQSGNHIVNIDGSGSRGVWCYSREDGGLGEQLVVNLLSAEFFNVLPIPNEDAPLD